MLQPPTLVFPRRGRAEIDAYSPREICTSLLSRRVIESRDSRAAGALSVIRITAVKRASVYANEKHSVLPLHNT